MLGQDKTPEPDDLPLEDLVINEAKVISEAKMISEAKVPCSAEEHVTTSVPSNSPDNDDNVDPLDDSPNYNLASRRNATEIADLLEITCRLDDERRTSSPEEQYSRPNTPILVPLSPGSTGFKLVDPIELNLTSASHSYEVDDSNFSVPTTDSGISIGDEVFPIIELASIECMINSPGWKVPVEPGKELEKLLNVSIELARTGDDDDNEACQKFYSQTLPNAFNKIMTDSAINGWISDIQGYIFDNTVRLVKLISLKISSENVYLLELLALVLNPTSKFHHYNASQASKTVPPSSQIPSADLFARPTDFRVPKGWLVDLINHFGKEGGFANLLQKFKSLKNPSLQLISAYLKSFGLCIEFLTSSCIQTYLVPCSQIVSDYIDGLSPELLKKETKVETRNDTLSALIKTMKMILQRAPNDRKKLLQGVELLHLQVILRLIQTSSFNGKMNALNELNRLITPFLFNTSRPHHEDSLTSDQLAQWLKDKKIVNTILTDYLHLPQYVEKLDKVFRFMIHEEKLTIDDVDLIWDAQIEKHEAIVKNIHDLLAKLAWVLTPDQLDAIFARFQKSWETADHKTKEKLLELMGRLAEDDKEGVISDKVLNVLWILIHSEDTNTEIIDIAMSTHVKILNYIYTHDKDTQRLLWIERCIQNIRRHQRVIPALKHLREMCKLYSESHHGYSYVHKMKQLERDNTLIQLVITDIDVYLEQMAVGKEATENTTESVTDPTDNVTENVTLITESIKPMKHTRTYPHRTELNERLDFIRFTLKHANCYLSLTHAVQLWNTLMSRQIQDTDIDIVFQWFSGLVGDDSDIEPSVSKELFVDKMLKLDPLLYTEAGIKCFESYFKEVNENEVHEAKSHQTSPSTFSDNEAEMLIGTDYIWRLVIEGREELTEYSISLLKDVYSSVTVSHQFVRHNEFIKTCFTKARQCFSQYETQKYPKILARQTVRILYVLREYIFDYLERSSRSETLLSHDRSWQGTPVILIAQLIGPNDKVVENIEVLTHTNETLGTIRQNLLCHIYKNEAPANLPQLQLKANNEELVNLYDKKPISQLDLKDRQVITARVLTSHHLASPHSTDSSTDLFNSPCSPIKQTKYIPWLLYVSDNAMRHGQTDLCDAVTMILNIFPTDVEIEEDILELAAHQAVETKTVYNNQPATSKSAIFTEYSATDSTLCDIFLDPNSGSVRYKLEIVYALLMPSAPSQRSVKFRSDFVLAGGIEIMLSLVTNKRFLEGSDQQMRRGSLFMLAKITKVLLTILCYATVSYFKKHSPSSRKVVVLQNSLISVPNPNSERVLRNISQQTCVTDKVTEIAVLNKKSVPTLEYIQVIIRLTWRCALGYPLVPDPIDETCKPSNIFIEDMVLAQELIENLTLCFTHQPRLLEDFLETAEFKTFILQMILVCSNQFIRQVISEQLYLMCVKCCNAEKPILSIIKLLFDNLPTTEEYGDNSSFYFGLLSRVLACASHHDIVVCNSEALLEQEVAWLKSVEHHNKHHPLNDTLLEGHLLICRELVAISPLSTKQLLGCLENGPNLLPSLLHNYLFPASKMISDHKKDPAIELTDYLPVCQVPNTQGAAFNLIGALCKGCVENLEYVVTQTKEMFYHEENEWLTLWDFSPLVQPRNTKGFVGLKNGGATCYMNSVIQQLYMIPEIRAEILSLPCPDNLEGLNEAKLHHVGVAQQVQTMFCALKESKHQYFTPDGFWRAFKLWGEPVNLREQHDSLEFFNALLDNLVEGMKALNQKPFIVDILEGSFADQKICKDCPHRYTRIEPFLSVSVDVRNHENLADSLDEFVKGDLLEGNNAYHCERCDRKVDTIKRLCFQKLPKILAIQLKRFGYDWERECAVKYNDYFEFPNDLSMEPYTVDHLSRIEETVAQEMIESGDRQDVATPSENSHYRLVGVVVHSGQASGGHYYSYIKQRIEEDSGETDRWYRFDDIDVSVSPIEEEGQMAKQCFGGDCTEFDSPGRKGPGRLQKRWWNAYILFYERVEHTSPNVVVPTTEIHCTPPIALVQQVRQENLKFLHQRAQFSPEFSQYIKHVILPNIGACRDRQSEQIALYCLDLVSSYLFQTGFRCKKAIRGRIEDWQEILLNLLRCNDVCRRWFAANYLFNNPNRFHQYLIESPMADVRSSFALIIVTLTKFAMSDPHLSLSELTAWTADGFSYSIDFVAPLSLHIISACYAIVRNERQDYNKNLQQYFHVFYCYAKYGNVERQQLINLGVHTAFMRIILEDGSCMRAQFNELGKMHSVITILIRCINLSSLRFMANGQPPNAVYPYKNLPMLSAKLDGSTEQYLVSDNYGYLKKLLEDTAVMELDDTIQFIKYVCWENARGSKELLLELLYYISTVYSTDLKPYLYCLLHLLLMSDSWQRKRILLVLKGTSERDTLLDIVQRNKSHHQKRAYQCMKCLTNLLTASSIAFEIFFEDVDNRTRWDTLVEWLGDQLERRPSFHNYNVSNNWNGADSSNVSNESSNEYYLERSNSAILTHQKALGLLPTETDSDEDMTSEEEASSATSVTDMSVSSQNTSVTSQNTSVTSQNTSVTQNISATTQNTSAVSQNTSGLGLLSPLTNSAITTPAVNANVTSSTRDQTSRDETTNQSQDTL